MSHESLNGTACSKSTKVFHISEDSAKGSPSFLMVSRSIPRISPISTWFWELLRSRSIPRVDPYRIQSKGRGNWRRGTHIQLKTKHHSDQILGLLSLCFSHTLAILRSIRNWSGIDPEWQKYIFCQFWDCWAFDFPHTFAILRSIRKWSGIDPEWQKYICCQFWDCWAFAFPHTFAILRSIRKWSGIDPEWQKYIYFCQFWNCWAFAFPILLQFWGRSGIDPELIQNGNFLLLLLLLSILGLLGLCFSPYFCNYEVDPEMIRNWSGIDPEWQKYFFCQFWDCWAFAFPHTFAILRSIRKWSGIDPEWQNSIFGQFSLSIFVVI